MRLQLLRRGRVQVGQPVELEHGVIDGRVEHVAHAVRGEHRHEHREHVVELPCQLEDHHRRRHRPRHARRHRRRPHDGIGSRGHVEAVPGGEQVECLAEEAAEGGPEEEDGREDAA